MRIMLRRIWRGADFRQTEFTNYDRFRKSKQFPGPLRKGEAFLFISKTGNQLLWILNVGNLNRGKNLGETRYSDSRKFRIEDGVWHPWMLQDFANEVGLVVFKANGERYKSFQEFFEESKQRMRERWRRKGNPRQRTRSAEREMTLH